MPCSVFKYLAGHEGVIHSLADISTHNKPEVKIHN